MNSPPPEPAPAEPTAPTWPLDVTLYNGLDIESLKFRSNGEHYPPAVCASKAAAVLGLAGGVAFNTKLFVGQDAVQDLFYEFLTGKAIGVFANSSYDLGLIAQRAYETLPEREYIAFLKRLKKALRGKRVFDVLLAQGLNDIYRGHHGKYPDGSDFKNEKGKVSDRYNLDIVTRIVLHRSNAKENDVFRKSYGLLVDTPVECWPPEAEAYPGDDTCNQLEVGLAQIFGALGQHSWVSGINGAGVSCKNCGVGLQAEIVRDVCQKSPRRPHQNLENLPFQVEAAFCLSIQAAHGFRTDPVRVEKLTVEAEAKNKIAVERFQKTGWIRADGTEDQAAVKKSVVEAYGNVVEDGPLAPCVRCNGTGRVPSYKTVECRGVKVKGRFQGCLAEVCLVCGGRRSITKTVGDKTCKVDDQGVGCDGTGYDLTSPRLSNLNRTDTGGVGTDRDTKMESGSEELSDYGEDEHAKTLSTYIPYLRKGLTGPLPWGVDALKATGRLSVEGSVLFQMPRQGGERKCIRARGAWCGYPIEMVIGSTDYAAGELCAMSQLTYWLFDYSQMRDVINASKNPGMLHSDMAAYVLGLRLEEFLVRYKAGDKQSKDFRQAMKPILFGKAGGMGDPKLVATNRKKNAGFTATEDGPSKNAKGVPGYWGIRFCILIGGKKRCGEQKITRTKNYEHPPVCKACVEVVAHELTPAYFKRYAEMKDYHKWAGKQLEAGALAPTVIWDAEAGKPRVVRERKCDGFSEFANNGFQSMLAEIMKAGYIDATWECFIGEKEDGTPSPLYGCRMPIVMHDEPVSELILSTAHLSGPRIADVMVNKGFQLAPDVHWSAETALGYYYSKELEPVYENDMLVPWDRDAV